ncbi:phage tail protein [Vibrio cincinnatiensis]|uniref:phage tail protein n=1 Tax=Vibrio cincinnatiensis TaxID=675 RepID=UPI001FA97F1D|nr:phage tail protein [Vibrio cincinnatiensis]
MSEPNEFISVQPDNRTLIEESLEYAWDRILKQSTSPYPDLKNPMLTPDEFVVLLASERGVADWQPDDTIDQQRKTTDKAFPIHSKAGTRTGLKTAVQALGYDAQVTSGHKLAEKIPYHVEILAWKEPSDLVDDGKIARLISRINTYKSERDSIEVAMTFAAFSSLEIRAASPACIGITNTVAKAAPWEQPKMYGSICAVSGMYSVSISTINAIAAISYPQLQADLAIRQCIASRSLSFTQYHVTAKL